VWPLSQVRGLSRRPTAQNSAPPTPADRCRSDRCRVPAGSVAESLGISVTAPTTRATPTTTGSATWAKPGPRRTPLLEPAPPPVPRPPALLRSAVLPRRLFPGRRLTRSYRSGQAEAADGTPGPPGAHPRQNPARTAGSPSADGPRPAGRRRPAHRLPCRRETTRCRAPAQCELDLSGRPQPASTVPRVLLPVRPARPRGLMTIGPSDRAERRSGEMAGLARCKPVPFLGLAFDQTECAAASPAWPLVRALRPHPPPDRRGRLPRCWTEPTLRRARVRQRGPPRQRGG